VRPGQLSTPHGIWVDRNDRVQVFDREGRYLDEWGDLDRPLDIYADDRGMIFVTDCIPRLNMPTPDGALAGRCRPTWDATHGVWGNQRGDLFPAEQSPSRITKLSRLDAMER
jgi:peptidylglycine monooxygenase